MNDSVKNNRKAERHPVGFTVTFSSAGGVGSAAAANISVGGMFIETEEDIPLNSDLKLTFKLPLKKTELSTMCRVVHKQQRDPASGRQAGIGVQFIDLTEEKKELLLDYIKDLDESTVNTEKLKTHQKPILFKPIYEEDDEAAEYSEEIKNLIKKYKNLKNADYYTILDVKKSASTEEIKKAYRAFCSEYHPDLFVGKISPALMEQLETIYNVITTAYKTLKNKKSRIKYDIDKNIMTESPVISKKEKLRLIEEKRFKKNSPDKYDQSMRLFKMACEAVEKGDTASALKTIQLARQMNPYNLDIEIKLKEIEKLSKNQGQY